MLTTTDYVIIIQICEIFFGSVKLLKKLAHVVLSHKLAMRVVSTSLIGVAVSHSLSM